MKYRHRVFLRSTSNIDSNTGYKQISLPPKVWKEMGWKINDHLKLDVIKMGMDVKLLVTKDEE